MNTMHNANKDYIKQQIVIIGKQYIKKKKKKHLRSA